MIKWLRLLKWHAALAATAISVLTGCTSMLATTSYNWSAGVNDQQCGAGAYYLPRRLLSIKFGPEANGRNRLLFNPTGDGPISVGDPRLPLCLDYLSSPSADDRLLISRTSDGLLTKITANAEDKSLEIATKEIDLLRLSAVAGGSSRANIISKVGDDSFAGSYQMDPFDIEEAAAINASIKDLGYCIYAEGHTFDPRRLTPEAYCRNPRSALAAKTPRFAAIDMEALRLESRRGVLYRPNQPHRIIVMQKLDPGGPGHWRRVEVYAVEMPNVAPVFSIGIDRSYFTDRTTILTFDAGILKDVQITKGSELNSMAEVPLRLAQAIVSIPAEIVQVRINRVKNEEALIDAQAKLLQTYRDFQQERDLLAQTQSQFQVNQKRQSCLAKGQPGEQKFEDCMNLQGG
jgi:hypothetical protein